MVGEKRIKMLTNCCSMPRTETKSGVRCSGCGHRQRVNGQKVGQTRDIARKNPGFIITELRGRHEAKSYGRSLQKNGNLSAQQFG